MGCPKCEAAPKPETSAGEVACVNCYWIEAYKRVCVERNEARTALVKAEADLAAAEKFAFEDSNGRGVIVRINLSTKRWVVDHYADLEVFVTRDAAIARARELAGGKA